ncbi:hypothetical protein [Prosthecobacter sp.]|uniref:hypothetical protein n=1 Tax=Prosthecobacter sp. TaxID=1965333 RepID=UPI00248900E3|nr:hypothetical protein [Prosthecobacter sp.]MDI1315097.1 hypothetical protein [Prosthecobacter sp.]
MARKKQKGITTEKLAETLGQIQGTLDTLFGMVGVLLHKANPKVDLLELMSLSSSFADLHAKSLLQEESLQGDLPQKGKNVTPPKKKKKETKKETKKEKKKKKA